MPRWEPNARERLITAALLLFSEQGYDKTTVGEIADKAGLTRSTFFRHFADKRAILAAGQETLSSLLTEGIAAAPAEASPLDAVEYGLVTAAAAMTPFNRDLATRLAAVVVTSTEMQERDQLKHVGLSASMAEALRARGVSAAAAALAGEVGMLAFKAGFAEWVQADAKEDLADLQQDLADRLRKAMAQVRGSIAELG
jgi:AcrR family transcriptional regulator